MSLQIYVGLVSQNIGFYRHNTSIQNQTVQCDRLKCQ